MPILPVYENEGLADEQFAFFAAIRGRDEEAILNGLDNPLNITCTNEVGATALHVAAGIPENQRVVQWLVESGADLNAKDEDGDTPLKWATCWGNGPMIKFLVGLGATLSAEAIAHSRTALAYYILGDFGPWNAEFDAQIVKLIPDLPLF